MYYDIASLSKQARTFGLKPYFRSIIALTGGRWIGTYGGFDKNDLITACILSEEPVKKARGPGRLFREEDSMLIFMNGHCDPDYIISNFAEYFPPSRRKSPCQRPSDIVVEGVIYEAGRFFLRTYHLCFEDRGMRLLWLEEVRLQQLHRSFVEGPSVLADYLPWA